MKLLAWISNYPTASPLIYIFLYAFLVAISFPVGAFLTILGGFLFDAFWGTFYTVIGATFGAIVIFLAARYALGEIIKTKLGKIYERIEKGFQKNGPWYLLFLRLIPLFPFWAVNIASALLPITLFTYFSTTFIGIIPGTFIYAQAGAGVGTIFDEREEFSLEAIFNWKIQIALLLLAIFSLSPILIKKWRKNDR